MSFFEVSHLSVRIDGTDVLKDINFSVEKGEVLALMGPNGSGKSSLAMTLLGSNLYEVTEGIVELAGTNLLGLTVDERAKAGLYVAWQNPMTIPGLSVFTLCKAAYEAVGKRIESVVEFKRTLEEQMTRVGLNPEYLARGVNEGFSGGEKKRLELMQMLLLEPQLVILDEIDSGLDVDALKLVGEVSTELAKKGTTFIVISHYKRMLEYVSPNKVSILKDGKILRSGGKELAEEIDKSGYKSL